MPQSQPPKWYLKVPPPIWLLFMLLAAFGIDRLFNMTPIAFLHLPPLALFLAFLAISVAAWSLITFVSAGTQIEPASDSNNVLVTHGPFRISRNPMYLSLVCLATGFALFAGTLPFFAVPFLIYLVCDRLFIPFEVAKMKRQFGEAYTAYLQDVRRWI